MPSGLLTILIVIALVPIVWWLFGLNYVMVANFAGTPISVGEIVGMRIRGINVGQVVNAYVILRRARVDIKVRDIELVLLAKQNLDNITNGLLTAKKNNVSLTFKQAFEADKKGTKIADEINKKIGTTS